MLRVLARLAVAALVAAAVGLGVPGPVEAATCGTTHGVTVVVDFHQLGGGVQTACDLNGGGENAATQLTDVGHTLTYAQRQPGFVCRVDGTPSSDPCVNTSPSDAYWSVWWSDGKSGRWSFSSQGVGSLTVPEGGYVALSWQGSSSRAAPRVAPTAHATSSPSPSSAPTRAPSGPTRHPATAPPAPPTSGPTAPPAPAAPTGAPRTGTTSATPLAHHPGRGRHHHQHHRTAPSPSTGDHAGGAPATTPVAPTGSGLPGWVAPGLVALLFAAAAAVFVVRRAGSGGR